MAEQLWSIVVKDLTSELRARQVWPAMLLLGVVVAFLFSVEFNLLPGEKLHVVGGFQWLTVCFATVITLGQTFALEREEGCWTSLLLYPVSPVVLYLSKLVMNLISLTLLQCALVPLIALLSNVPLFEHPWQLTLIVLLGNLGMASVATLIGALGVGLRQSGNLAALLALPLLVPVVLAASAATRLMVEESAGPEWWRWIRLLGTFAIVFVTTGMVLFEFVIEE
ncbi:MAG: heme exporter protein CcmB [Pirellulales bacterium]